MGGAHVFPGGRVDAADRDADEAWCDGIDARDAAARRASARRGASRITSRRPASCSRRPACCSRGTAAASSCRWLAPTTRRGSRGTAPTSTTAEIAARGDRARAAAAGARRARAVRALGDAADRHAAVRHALLHDARAAGSDAGARRHRDDAQLCGSAGATRIAQSLTRRNRAAAADLDARCASSSRSRRSKRRWRGRATRTIVRRMPKLHRAGRPPHAGAARRSAASRSRRRRSAASKRGSCSIDRRWRAERAAHVESGS